MTPPEVLTFDVMVTLEDQLALQLRCLATPVMQAGRLRREVTVVLIAAACAPFIFAAGALIAWLGDRNGPSLGALLRSLVIDEPGSLAVGVLVMVGCTVAGAILQRRLLRPRIRRVLRRILRVRPDVDPADPQLAYRARVTISEEGVESRTTVGATVISWTVLKGWEENGGYLMMLGDAMVGFCIRVSAAEPEAMARLRAILTARLGPKDQGMIASQRWRR